MTSARPPELWRHSCFPVLLPSPASQPYCNRCAAVLSHGCESALSLRRGALPKVDDRRKRVAAPARRRRKDRYEGIQGEDVCRPPAGGGGCTEGGRSEERRVGKEWRARWTEST